MGDSSIQFHKIWIDQCEATEGIRERFGLDNALHYLIGEKLFSFVHAAEDDLGFAAELPAVVAKIGRIFSAADIRKATSASEVGHPIHRGAAGSGDYESCFWNFAKSRTLDVSLWACQRRFMQFSGRVALPVILLVLLACVDGQSDSSADGESSHSQGPIGAMR